VTSVTNSRRPSAIIAYITNQTMTPIHNDQKILGLFTPEQLEDPAALLNEIIGQVQANPVIDQPNAFNTTDLNNGEGAEWLIKVLAVLGSKFPELQINHFAKTEDGLPEFLLWGQNISVKIDEANQTAQIFYGE
jgi:hypothetical protein